MAREVVGLYLCLELGGADGKRVGKGVHRVVGSRFLRSYEERTLPALYCVHLWFWWPLQPLHCSSR